ncbi:MAG: hypothetical protein ACI81P_000860 [Neolewinella sp.]|jgi:hypothetical protein
MKDYFKLQKVIVERFLRGWGLAPWLVYLLVPILFVTVSLLLIERTDYAAYLIAAGSLTAYNSFSGRKRNDFLQLQFGKAAFRKIRLLENGLVTLPFLLLFLFKGFWALALVQLLVGGAMTLRSGGGFSSFALPTPFSRHPFEFALGFRQYWWLLLIAVFLLVMGIRADNFELSVFAWFITVFGAMSFYQRPEPGFYVWVHSLTGKQLLNRKLMLGCGHLVLLGLPFVVSLLIFFPDQWALIAGGQLLALLYLSLVITVKYAAYPDEMDIVKAFIVASGMVIPPLLLFLIPYYYQRAVRRLGLVLA